MVVKKLNQLYKPDRLLYCVDASEEDISAFAQGYSSLSLLTEMPLDTLKIDKSFVDKIGTDNEHREDVTVIPAHTASLFLLSAARTTAVTGTAMM